MLKLSDAVGSCTREGISNDKLEVKKVGRDVQGACRLVALLKMAFKECEWLNDETSEGSFGLGWGSGLGLGLGLGWGSGLGLGRLGGYDSMVELFQYIYEWVEPLILLENDTVVEYICFELEDELKGWDGELEKVLGLLEELLCELENDGLLL